MTGKQIFWNKSIETDISEIIQEILHYVDSQRDNGTLNPNYYDSILLLIAEILPYVKEKERWTDLGYLICRNIKESIENSVKLAHPTYNCIVTIDLQLH